MLRRCANGDQKHHITMCKDSFVLFESELDRHKIARTFEKIYFLKEKKKATGRERKK